MSRIRKRENLEQLITTLAGRFPGTIALAARNLSTGEDILVNADAIVPTASVIKLAILVEVFRQSREGMLDLEERLPLHEVDIAGGSGVLKELGPGLNLRIVDLATLMIVMSDNTATNMLIDRVGGNGPINQTMQQYGLTTVHLHHRVDWKVIGRDSRRFGEASPRDLMHLCEMMHRRQLVDEPSSSEMLDILLRQHFLDQVPRYLNCRPRPSGVVPEPPAPSLRVACKTGFSSGVRADAGLIFLPRDVVIAYCAVADQGNVRPIGPEALPAIVNGVLGRLLVEYWWPDATIPADTIADSPYFETLCSEA